MWHRTDTHDLERDEGIEAGAPLADDRDDEWVYVRAYRADHDPRQPTRSAAPRDARALGLGLLLGAALGAGVALLMAPASGEDTRRQLRRGTRRLYARGAEAVDDLRDDADRMARRVARRGAARSRELAEDMRDRLGV